jgi:hypothetical protein
MSYGWSPCSFLQVGETWDMCACHPLFMGNANCGAVLSLRVYRPSTPILLLFFVKVMTVAADWLVLGLLLGTGSGSLTLLLNHRRSGRSLSPRYHSALCLVKQCQYPVKLAVGGHFLIVLRLDDRQRRRDRFWLIQAWSDLSRKGDAVVEFHHSSCISAKSRTLTKESNRSWLGVLIPTSMTSVSPQNELVLFLQC